MIPQNIKKILRRGKIIYLATASKDGTPNLISVASCGIVKDKILIADCQFFTTLSNITENNKVVILASNRKEYYRIRGEAEYITSGQILEKVKKINENTEFKPKGAVLISITDIYDLDKCKKIDL